jgi:hypothetical protein
VAFLLPDLDTEPFAVAARLVFDVDPFDPLEERPAEDLLDELLEFEVLPDEAVLEPPDFFVVDLEVEDFFVEDDLDPDDFLVAAITLNPR